MRIFIRHLFPVKLKLTPNIVVEDKGGEAKGDRKILPSPNESIDFDIVVPKPNLNLNPVAHYYDISEQCEG